MAARVKTLKDITQNLKTMLNKMAASGSSNSTTTADGKSFLQHATFYTQFSPYSNLALDQSQCII